MPASLLSISSASNGVRGTELKHWEFALTPGKGNQRQNISGNQGKEVSPGCCQPSSLVQSRERLALLTGSPPHYHAQKTG